MTKDELLFNAWLTSLNQRLGRYVVRLIAGVNEARVMDAGMPMPLPPSVLQETS